MQNADNISSGSFSPTAAVVVFLVVAAVVAGLIFLFIAACGGRADPVASDVVIITGPETFLSPEPDDFLSPEPDESTAMQQEMHLQLVEFADTIGDSLVKRKWAVAHSLHSDDFRARCSLLEFEALMSVNANLRAIPEEAEAALTATKMDGDYGWFVNRFTVSIRGDTFIAGKVGEDDADEESDEFWHEEPDAQWVDGRWVVYEDEESKANPKPCVTFVEEE